jgi:hypothetical protein
MQINYSEVQDKDSQEDRIVRLSVPPADRAGYTNIDGTL